MNVSISTEIITTFSEVWRSVVSYTHITCRRKAIGNQHRRKKSTACTVTNHKYIWMDKRLDPSWIFVRSRNVKICSFSKVTLKVQLLLLSKESIKFGATQNGAFDFLLWAARIYKPQHSCQRSCGVPVCTSSLGAWSTVINPHRVVCSCLQ